MTLKVDFKSEEFPGNLMISSIVSYKLYWIGYSIEGL